MNLDMNKKGKIVVMAAILAATILTIFWATSNQHTPWVERLGWERWHLKDEQRIQIEQLIEEMRGEGASWKEIRDATRVKLEEWGVKHPPPGDIELYYIVKTVISSVNAVLLVVLLVIYFNLYKQTRSEFTLGLILFAMVLLLYALSSSPLVHQVFGFSAFGLGPFAMLPDFFTLIALIILLYQTFK